MMKNIFQLAVCTLILLLVLVVPVVAAEGGETKVEHLATQLQNPIASLISIPFQNNWEAGLGTTQSGTRYTLRFQPVVPTVINRDWNMITRPIISYVSQRDVFGGTSQSGLSDTQLEIFFTPNQFQKDALLWGVGPVILIPTASETLLGTEKWGIGPSACALKQGGGWTYGALFTHLWSVAGNADRAAVSLSYLQPFLSRTTKMGTAITFSSETSYDWTSGQLTVPLIAGVGQILPLFGHYFNCSLAGVYHLSSPTNISPWACRFNVTLLLPKK
jgi:hypothetical protein